MTLQELRVLVRERLNKRRSELIVPDPPPRYDEEFYKFLMWLNKQ